MSSVHYLREFINERLIAAAEEIFKVFEITIVEYEEEIDRQRRLLDIVWKPEVKLHQIEPQQQHVCQKEEEEVLCDQERSSSLDQEEPEPPQIKEEEEELRISQEGEQLVLKEETEAFMLTPAHEESDHCEDETLDFNPDKSQSAAQSHRGDSGSPGNHQDNSHLTNGFNSTVLKIFCNPHTGKKSLKCDTCGKGFKYKSKLQRHQSNHTGEKLFSCTICEKRFSNPSILNVHRRIHTGEKPFSCKTCGKSFRCSSGLLAHMRAHTGEKPYCCTACGKGFKWSSCMTLHMRTHSGERPYSCQTCGRDFRSSSNLKGHMRTHTGPKLHPCSAEVSAGVSPVQVRRRLLAEHGEEVSV